MEDDGPAAAAAAAAAATAPLLPEFAPISFRSGRRSFKDLPFLVLFLFLVLATVVLGILAISFRNPDYSKISSFSFDPDSSSCVLRRIDGSLRSSSLLEKDLAWTLAITVLLCFPIALLLLRLLKSYSKQVIFASIPFFLLIPTLLNLYWFVACSLKTVCREAFPLVYRILALIFVFVLIGIAAWIIIVNWHRVDLTSRIIAVAADGLSQNWGLLAVVPALFLALIVCWSPVVVFLIIARQNGRIVPRSTREGVYYCSWKEGRWVPAYYAIGIITMVWSLMVMIQAQVYVISGTIAGWYFSREEEDRPQRLIRSSLRNAFGPSFGTLCFSGLAMAGIRIIRAVVDISADENEPHGCIKMMLQCCTRFLFSAFHFVNKFAINFAAVTGEAYCSSSYMVYELLRRNLLSVVFVETVSTRILIGISFVISAVYAIVAWVILKSVSSPGAASYLAAGSSFIVLMMALGFLTFVLDEVIDTVYVCFAIDKDKGEVSKQNINSVYVLLPLSRSGTADFHFRTPLLS